MKRPSIQSILTFLIGWPLSLVAIYFIYTRVTAEKDTILSNIAGVNVPLLLLGTGCFILYYYLRSIVWYRLLHYYHVNLSYKESTSLWAVTQLKRYIPGNIWSFLGLTVLLSKKGIEKKDILKAILFEQQFVVIACVIVMLLGLPYYLGYMFPEYQALVRLAAPLTGIGTAIYIYNRTLLSVVPGKARSFLEHLFPPFAKKENSMLIALSAVSFFILGAGYYFVIVSVTPVTPALFFQIIGLVIFSLLIGVLSFITPTGLGVREGVLAFGLSKIMEFSLAGFVALLSRIFLIIAELLFVITAYAWDKIQHGWVLTLESHMQKHTHLVLVLLGTTIFTTYFTVAGFLRYDNFYTGKFDLGNMSQTVWNTYQGSFFQMSDPNGAQEVSRLAYHADFILLFFAPLYYVWESPKLLLIIQAAVVSLGAVFVYLLGRKILKNKNLALVFAIAYLINPAIHWTLLYDFHAVVLGTTFLLGAFYFMLKKRYLWFVVFAILAGITKEQVWFVTALLGLYIMLFQKNWRIGITVFLGSLFVFYALLWHVIPDAAGSSGHFALEYYEGSGESPSSLIQKTIFSPVETFYTLTDEARTQYIRQLLAPLGFLSVLFPFPLIFASGDIGINLLSSKEHLHQIYYQYSAVITPFIFVSALYGAYYLRRFVPGIPVSALAVYIIFASLFTSYAYGPMPGARKPNIVMFTKPHPDREHINQKLAELPSVGAITATNNLGAHLSHREQLYVIPNGTESADLAVFLLTESAIRNESKEYVSLKNVLSDPNYELIHRKSNFYILKRR